MTETAVDTENNNGAFEGTETIEQADARLVELQSQLEKQNKLVEKLRANEKHNQQLAKEAGAKNLEEALRNITNGYNKEVDEWKSKYEQVTTQFTTLKEQVQTQQINNVLKDVLSKHNVKDINTTMKIVDKQQIQWNDQGEVDISSIETLVEGLKSSDPILFDIPKVPSAQPAGEGTNVGGFEKELSACRSQKEIEAVMRKYGKL